MSDRRFDMSGLQVTASVLAAVTGAVLASYLGVAGTIIGTAVMSVAGTAGTAVYKHYLGSTASHLKETATVAVAHRATEWMTVGTRTTAAHGQAAGDTAAGDTAAGKTSADSPAGAGKAGAGDQDATETAAAGGAGQQDEAARPAAGWLARWRATVLGWPRWLRLAAASAVIFVGVIGGISVVEAAAGKPLQTVVWNHKASGTTVGSLVGGQPSNTTRPARPHVGPSSTAPASSAPASGQTGSATPSPSPSSSSASPSPSTSTSSPPASSSPSPSPAGSGTAKAATG
jgi:hypothetical protein